MDKHLEEEALMKNLMEELPMSNEMPPHVRAKAINIAVESHRKAKAARRPRAAAWFTAGVAAFTVGTLVMMPRPAKAWSMVAQAVEKITSVQMDLVVKDPDGKEEKVQIAMRGAEMMVNAGDGTTVLFDKEGLQVYESKSNTLTKMKMPAELLAFMPNVAEEIAGAFDLKKEIAEMEKKFGKDHIVILPFRTQDGRKVYDVQMTEPDGPGTAFLTIDASSDLPIYIDASGEDGEDLTIHLRYNGQVQFRPKFPANAKIKELDLTKMDKMFDGKKLEEAFKGFESFGKGSSIRG